MGSISDRITVTLENNVSNIEMMLFNAKERTNYKFVN